MQVPLLDLKRQYEQVGPKLEVAVLEVLRSGQYILGPAVESFEADLAQLCGVRHAIAVSSGTDALLAALVAIHLQPGDQVIVPAFSFFASASVVQRLGAVPVFVDIDARTYLMDPIAVYNAITPRTRAIMPVHLYGQMCDLAELTAIAAPHNIVLIEDAAQAIGASRNGLGLAQASAAAALSFYPTKNVGGVGEGGGILTNDDEFAAECRAIRHHGQIRPYLHEMTGGNFRMDAVQAAALAVKLAFWRDWKRRRQEIAARYDAEISSTVATPITVDGADHTFHQYVIAHPQRNRLREHLSTAGVDTGIFYPVPLNRQPCFAHLPSAEQSLPNAESAAASVLAIPVYPELQDNQVDHVIDSINAFVTADQDEVSSCTR